MDGEERERRGKEAAGEKKGSSEWGRERWREREGERRDGEREREEGLLTLVEVVVVRDEGWKGRGGEGRYKTDKCRDVVSESNHFWQGSRRPGTGRE